MNEDAEWKGEGVGYRVGRSGRKNLDSPHLSLAFTFSSDALNVDQGSVDNSAILGVHRIKDEGQLGYLDTLRGLEGHQLEFLPPCIAISTGIEIDLEPCGDGIGEYSASDVLQGVE